MKDPTRFFEWQHGVVSGHMEGDAPHGVGARCLTTRRIGFAERSVTSEITHIEPPRTWGARAIDGPIRVVVNVMVAAMDRDRRSRISVEMDFNGRGIGKLLVPPVVRPQARREMPPHLRRLKERWEVGGDHSTESGFAFSVGPTSG